MVKSLAKDHIHLRNSKKPGLYIFLIFSTEFQLEILQCSDFKLIYKLMKQKCVLILTGIIDSRKFSMVSYLVTFIKK